MFVYLRGCTLMSPFTRAKASAEHLKIFKSKPEKFWAPVFHQSDVKLRSRGDFQWVTGDGFAAALFSTLSEENSQQLWMFRDDADEKSSSECDAGFRRLSLPEGCDNHTAKSAWKLLATRNDLILWEHSHSKRLFKIKNAYAGASRWRKLSDGPVHDASSGLDHVLWLEGQKSDRDSSIGQKSDLSKASWAMNGDGWSEDGQLAAIGSSRPWRKVFAAGDCSFGLIDSFVQDGANEEKLMAWGNNEHQQLSVSTMADRIQEPVLLHTAKNPTERIDQVIGTATQIFTIIQRQLHHYDSKTQTMVPIQYQKNDVGPVQHFHGCATHLVTAHLQTAAKTTEPLYNIFGHGWVPSPLNNEDPEDFVHEDFQQKPILLAENVPDLLAVGCGQGYSLIITGRPLDDWYE